MCFPLIKCFIGMLQLIFFWTKTCCMFFSSLQTWYNRGFFFFPLESIAFVIFFPINLFFLWLFPSWFLEALACPSQCGLVWLHISLFTCEVPNFQQISLEWTFSEHLCFFPSNSSSVSVSWKPSGSVVMETRMPWQLGFSGNPRLLWKLHHSGQN